MSITEKQLADAVQFLEKEGIRNSEKIRNIERELAELNHRTAAINRRNQILSTSLNARRLIDQSIVWRPGAILIVVTIIAGMTFAMTRSITVGVVIGVLTLLASTFLFLYPTDADASASIQKGSNEAMLINSTVTTLSTQLEILISIEKSTSEKLAVTQQQLEREQILASVEYRRKLLLKENWKAMRAVEFESFLERVFIELGYSVETTRVTGDQGVDLIVSHRGRRVAIQVKGYVSSVTGGAIQEAFTGMACYQCDACAAITNSVFTSSATDMANKVGCQLIDENLEEYCQTQ